MWYCITKNLVLKENHPILIINKLNLPQSNLLQLKLLQLSQHQLNLIKSNLPQLTNNKAQLINNQVQLINNQVPMLHLKMRNNLVQTKLIPTKILMPQAFGIQLNHYLLIITKDINMLKHQASILLEEPDLSY